jgi:hypothetical protein
MRRLLRPLSRATEYMLWAFDDERPAPVRQRLRVHETVAALVRARTRTNQSAVCANVHPFSYCTHAVGLRSVWT